MGSRLDQPAVELEVLNIGYLRAEAASFGIKNDVHFTADDRRWYDPERMLKPGILCLEPTSTLDGNRAQYGNGYYDVIVGRLALFEMNQDFQRAERDML